MIACSLIDLTNQISGRLIGEDRLVDVVFTDTRRHSNDIEEGASLFVALRGPNFDGNDYISDISGTVSAVVVDRECDITVPQIVVENTRLALARIAHLNRQRSKAEFIAVTGSSGKTTVKEMIAAILSNIGRSYATRGNLNNDIGVPLSILEIDSTIEYAVLELGANHQGEIAFTSHITEPKVALVNNVSEAHLQGFGDINGVARAKAEIYASLTEDGIAVVNADDSFYDFFLQQITTESLSFSVKNTADVYATNIISREEQKYSFTINYNEQQQVIHLPLIGEHNVSNALAAATCCIAIGVSLKDIEKGLSKSPIVSGRLVMNHLDNATVVIDDTYNANVSSVIAAINLLAQYKAPKILILGDMGELGQHARKYHEQVGLHAKACGIDRLYTCGALTEFTQRSFSNDSDILDGNNKEFHFSDQLSLIKKLKQDQEANKGAAILVKGSRSAQMEIVVSALIDSSEISATSNEPQELRGIASRQEGQ